MNTAKNKRRLKFIATIANKLHKKGLSLSDAFKQAHREYKKLVSGELIIAFYKKDGTKTIRKATRNAKLISKYNPTIISTSNKKNQKSLNAMPFYDLEKKAFRSFIIDNYIV